MEYKLKDKNLLKRLFYYMRPYLHRYILGIILMGIIVGLDLLNPYVISLILKELGQDIIDMNYIVILFFIGILSTIALNIVQYFHTLLMHKTGHKIIYKIRNDIFHHIQTLSHHQFNDIPVGTLVTRNTSDTNVLFQLYTNVILNVLKYIVTIIGVLIAMFLIDKTLAFIVLLILPLIVTLTFVFRTILRKVHRVVRNEVSGMNAFLSENISGMKVTQIFNQEEKKYKEFKEQNNRLKKASIKEIFTFGIFRPLIYLVFISTVIICMTKGGSDNVKFTLGVVTVAISYDQLYAFYLYINKFFNPIQMLADQFNQLQSSFASAEKIFSILDIEPEIKDHKDARDIDMQGVIEFKNVWFSYIPNEWILKDVSFKINAKDVVAFVGATGAGKSTILGLITRNYDIQKGEILIDGINILDLKISSLRSQIGQMLQDVFLFSGTIAENIRLNDDSITDLDIINACKEVNAIHFINKHEEGIYREVGERGNNLSLGERQLISFARTIVHKPKVMILDEATSNIDTETEKLIQDTLNKVIKNNTMIMVAHRLSTIQHATKIIVFDRGRIVEMGNHQELLKLKGKYYQLYQLQYEKKVFD